MLCEAASPWQLNLHILDTKIEFPAGPIAPNFEVGDFTRYDDVLKFGKNLDVISIEIEKVNLEALIELEDRGKVVIPSSQVLRTIRDKGLQKEFYKERHFPTSAFELYENKKAIWQDILVGKLDYPFVQKARRDGYDGRGVAVILSEDDLPKLMDVPSVVEDLVDIKKELSLIIGRNRHGQMTSFPLVEMEFDPAANLVNILLCPAEIEDKTRTEALKLGEDLVEALELTGLLAIELFLDKDDTLWINEVAPRPHNSGHHTIEACNYSQYNIHLRCLLDLPLPAITLNQPAGMLNLLGADHVQGKPCIEGLGALMAMPDTYLHWYGKPETRPQRKMGHVTTLGKDLATV
jgi:5-(carboxyamino)imidazole ribonucleotide synthase